jgi:hypothetical protein
MFETIRSVANFCHRISHDAAILRFQLANGFVRSGAIRPTTGNRIAKPALALGQGKGFAVSVGLDFELRVERAKRYRDHAAGAVQKAETAIDQTARATYVQLAQRWLDLADEVERKGTGGLTN